MSNTLKPLTSADLSDLKAKAKAEKVPMPSTFLRLIDMIERRDEQIEKMRKVLQCSRDQLADQRIGTIDYMEGSQIYADFRIAVALADEALAATEPVNDKR